MSFQLRRAIVTASADAPSARAQEVPVVVAIRR
jgi:hypothetical protein